LTSNGLNFVSTPRRNSKNCRRQQKNWRKTNLHCKKSQAVTSLLNTPKDSLPAEDLQMKSTWNFCTKIS
jgi:hypothetical protein